LTIEQNEKFIYKDEFERLNWYDGISTLDSSVKLTDISIAEGYQFQPYYLP